MGPLENQTGNIKSEAVNIPQIKMGDEELQTFLKGFDNLYRGINTLSKFDFSSSSSTFEYQSEFKMDETPHTETTSNAQDTINQNATPAKSTNDDELTEEQKAKRAEKLREMQNPSPPNPSNFNLKDITGNRVHSNLNIYLDAYATGGKSLLGRLIPNFPHYCPVCGKEIGGGEKWGEYVKMIPFDGFCSFKCATKSAMDFVINAFMPTMEQDSQWIEDIEAVLNFINALCNMVNELPYVITNMARIPDIYKNYILSKLFIIFNLIKILVNKALIQKNKLLIWILNKLKLGTVGQKILSVMEWINTAMQAINALVQAFEVAYGVAEKIITEALRMFCIDAEGMGFFMTTRSMLITPGQMLLKIDKNANLKISAIDAINGEAIMNLIKVSLPPIQEPEYFLDPDVFEVRYLLSNENYKLVGKIIDMVLPVLKFGADYLPTWEHLRPWNPFFLVALAYGWCPTTQACFAFEMGTEIPAVAASFNAKQATQI